MNEYSFLATDERRGTRILGREPDIAKQLQSRIGELRTLFQWFDAPTDIHQKRPP
jgi:hypothetical protein